MVMTMNSPKNKTNLDIRNKPLPIYKNMDNSMNSLVLRGQEKINTNIQPPTRVTQILPSITPTLTIIQPTSNIIPPGTSRSTQPYMYSMLSSVQTGNIHCGACGGST